MAIDQAILDDVTINQIPTLRFYDWNQPTLSLGYFQSYELPGERFAEVAKVRRSTGGGAILHDHELTYSLAMPMPGNQTGARSELYRDVHASIAGILAEHGVAAHPFRDDPKPFGSDKAFLCFQRRTDEDLVVSGYKILGSAQRRTKTAVLQHGSLLLKASRWAPELPGIHDLTSASLSAKEIADEFAQAFAELHNIHWQKSQVPDELKQKAQPIRTERFDSDSWWHRH
ncbi:lipoate--protein ligase family protein [Stieleria varia]|nr:lipoate--protein ligase family protein [Stieleria varia]